MQEKPGRYLGEEISQDENFVVARSMAHYFEKVDPVAVDKKADEESVYEDLTPLRSRVMKMAGPARKV